MLDVALNVFHSNLIVGVVAHMVKRGVGSSLKQQTICSLLNLFRADFLGFRFIFMLINDGSGFFILGLGFWLNHIVVPASLSNLILIIGGL